MNNNTKRLFWADLVRIIAIYLVIQFHVAYNPVNKISVPLFIVLSGALLLVKKETYIIFYKKRAIKFLIPWVIWTVIYMVYFLYFADNRIAIKNEFFSGSLENNVLITWIYYFLKMFFSALWFLPMIFGIYILTPFLRILMQRADSGEKYLIVILWFLFFSFFPSFINNPFFPRYEPNLLFSAFQFIGYFTLGYLLLYLPPSRKTIFFTLATFLVSLLFLFISDTQDEYWGFLEPATVFTTVTVFYLFYVTFTKLEKLTSDPIKKIVSAISGACFGIYVLHGLLLSIEGGLVRNALSDMHLGFVITPIVFITTLIIILIIQRIPILKYIVP